MECLRLVFGGGVGFPLSDFLLFLIGFVASDHRRMNLSWNVMNVGQHGIERVWVYEVTWWNSIQVPAVRPKMECKLFCDWLKNKNKSYFYQRTYSWSINKLDMDNFCKGFVMCPVRFLECYNNKYHLNTCGVAIQISELSVDKSLNKMIR